MNIEKEEIEVNGLVFYSKEDDRYTITYDGSGGAIAHDKDLDNCKKEFENLMKFAVAYKSIKNFITGKNWTKIKSFTYSPVTHV